MAWWDSAAGKIVYGKPRAIPGYPGWTEMDCGCCGGIEWGGEQPRECRSCNGIGAVAKHEISGTLAEYPGGPFLGREAPLEAERGE